MIYNCCNQNRKAAVQGNPWLNGIDYLEVLDHLAPPDSPRQQTLFVYCLKAAPANLQPGNVLIQGGESITGITVLWLGPAISTAVALPQARPDELSYFHSLPNAGNVLVIRTSVAGDFSPYILRLVNNAVQAGEDPFQVTEALTGFDPELATVEFSFKVECGPNFDCAPPGLDCPPELPAPPPINYLAKDFGSFRSIILDRLNQLLPSWGGSSEADLGIALAEVIAYAGDYLSYQQDAVGTEAYLETARRRISLRRHARLVDYFVHDGCNSRAWIQLQVSGRVLLQRGTARFCTKVPGMPANLAIGSGNEQAALILGVTGFEPMEDAILYPEHNIICFYTWGNTDCCLPQGATEATLRGSLTHLQPGDVLIFKEVTGPQTGNPADADIRHRCAVRLTRVTTQDGQGNLLIDPLFEKGTGNPIVNATQQPTPVTEIQWSAADALPFPVCLSSTFLNQHQDEQILSDVSVVLGNVVLADQGLTFNGVKLPIVPQPLLYQPPNPAADRCQPTSLVPIPVRYQPVISQAPLTQAVPLPLAESPVTPGIVALLPVGPASLTDANGSICLMIQAADPAQWPQFFGVLVTTDGGNFDLAVVYQPLGLASRVVLESFPGLSFNAAHPNDPVTVINSQSQLITVSPANPAASTNPLPPQPVLTMLKIAGSVPLQVANETYLMVQATSPRAWPASFGVVSQGYQQQPEVFNLLVVYDPTSGGVGVPIPVVVESFNQVSLANISQAVGSGSKLITVQSFENEPNLSLSAYDLMNYDASEAVPVITLSSTDPTAPGWTPEPDLLESGPTDADFVVEVESEGTAQLRFGDGTNGQSAASGTVFTAFYRIGNGTAGNVGADTLVVPAGTDPLILACGNPLPATGGVDPETTDQIRRRAPQAFMTQERAITMPDYETVAESVPQVDQAVATLRWTGSWHTVFITAEPVGAGNLTPALSQAVRKTVDRYRLAGQDIQLESPEYVPLQVELSVCVDPDYFQQDVVRALLQVLGSGMLPNGQKGLFYPDNFTFGQTVYLSPIYAAARTVAGVVSVVATVFAPQGVTTNVYLAKGEIPLGPFQIARLDNDRSFPNHGQLKLKPEGGK